MICAPNNVMCLGRSGTGKTTSSALRLFSTDAMYKFLEQKLEFLAKSEVGQPFKPSPDFMFTKSSLKLIFVTASPVLTNEVKKFYSELKDHIKIEL